MARSKASGEPGQLLVHELVHAWPIEHSHVIPGLMCSGIKNEVGTLGGNMDVYKYGPSTQNFDEFNLEQQASIVDEWFAGTAYKGQQHSFQPMFENEKNPYWRYIRDNIRAGIG